jgi:hypothetical protein
MIDYIDIKSYNMIREELFFRDININSIINVETKKEYFRIWFKKI